MSRLSGLFGHNSRVSFQLEDLLKGVVQEPDAHLEWPPLIFFIMKQQHFYSHLSTCLGSSTKLGVAS